MLEKVVEKAKIRLAKLWGFVVWFLVLMLIISTLRNIGSVRRVRADVAAEREKLAKIQKDNEDLKNQIALAQSPNFVENEIRNKLGLVKSGEAVVILPDVETLRKLAPQMQAESDILPDPNWKKWLKLFAP